jgi:hypothetical protein
MQLIRSHSEFVDVLLQSLLYRVELCMDGRGPGCGRWRCSWLAKAESKSVLLDMILMSGLNMSRVVIDLLRQVIHQVPPSCSETNAQRTKIKHSEAVLPLSWLSISLFCLIHNWLAGYCCWWLSWCSISGSLTSAAGWSSAVWHDWLSARWADLLSLEPASETCEVQDMSTRKLLGPRSLCQRTWCRIRSI